MIQSYAWGVYIRSTLRKYKECQSYSVGDGRKEHGKAVQVELHVRGVWKGHLENHTISSPFSYLRRSTQKTPAR